MRKTKRNKRLIIVGLMLISLSTLFSFNYIYNHYRDKHETERIIKELFFEEDKEIVADNDTIIEEQPKVKKQFNLSNNYLGYIELSKYGIKRLIATGTDKHTLDKGLVGTMNISAMLDDEFGNIILAGHNNSNVFQKLHKVKIHDYIKVVSHKQTYIYRVNEIHTINDDDFLYFNKVKDKKILTLITCKNNNKRLIVIAELRG